MDRSFTSFKYLGSVTTDEGSEPEMLSRVAQTTAALTRLKSVWNDRCIPLSSKIRLIRYLVTPIFLFAKSPWAVENREKWRKLVVKSSVVPQRPSRLRDR